VKSILIYLAAVALAFAQTPAGTPATPAAPPAAAPAAPTPAAAPVKPPMRTIQLGELQSLKLRDIGKRRSDFLQAINSAATTIMGGFNNEAAAAVASACEEAGGKITPADGVQFMDPQGSVFKLGTCEINTQTMTIAVEGKPPAKK